MSIVRPVISMLSAQPEMDEMVDDRFFCKYSSIASVYGTLEMNLPRRYFFQAICTVGLASKERLYWLI